MAKSKDLNFEQTIAELEKLVAQLEKGDLPLEEALQVFEQGIKLAKSGQDKLTKAKQRVQILLEKHSQAELADFENVLE